MITYLIITEYEIIEVNRIDKAIQIQKGMGGTIVSKCKKKGKIIYNPPINF